MEKYLVFNFDGTWNGEDDDYPTNVRRFNTALGVSNSAQRSYYFEGPGNEEDNLIEHFLGGAFGIGCIEIRDTAYDVLRSMFEPGDKIVVTGFSRGAAIARMFCHVAAQDGFEIDFLGCWDTVFARLPFGKFQQESLFGDLHVSPKVKQACHAVALDEDRTSFTPNLMNDRDGIVEVWFKGNHGDVGGGYKDRGLADVTLHWMVREARAATSLQFAALPPMGMLNDPHREKKPLRRTKRYVGVKINDLWSGKIPLIYRYQD